ncbi:hypothetical protein B0H15DRAFT_438521 [Mycena belliarum]|uniref:Uncharacterized protein n=1 Tax=Mycena belliarum TaxID=1033014 RepID=A0AAD6TX98_9AGAR|nr:hypothetical protein B0H15DRAFT_438521 [Mycena belliae]
MRLLPTSKKSIRVWAPLRAGLLPPPLLDAHGGHTRYIFPNFSVPYIQLMEFLSVCRRCSAAFDVPSSGTVPGVVFRFLGIPVRPLQGKLALLCFRLFRRANTAVSKVSLQSHSMRCCSGISGERLLLFDSDSALPVGPLQPAYRPRARHRLEMHRRFGEMYRRSLSPTYVPLPLNACRPSGRGDYRRIF